jgi:hypothetical protein
MLKEYEFGPGGPESRRGFEELLEGKGAYEAR